MLTQHDVASSADLVRTRAAAVRAVAGEAIRARANRQVSEKSAA
jgi:hypothetical protein